MSDPIREALDYLLVMSREWREAGHGDNNERLAMSALDALDRERGATEVLLRFMGDTALAAVNHKREKLTQAREIVGRMTLENDRAGDGTDEVVVAMRSGDYAALRRALGMEVDGE